MVMIMTNYQILLKCQRQQFSWKDAKRQKEHAYNIDGYDEYGDADGDDGHDDYDNADWCWR